MAEEKKMTLREEFERIREEILNGKYRDSTHYFFTEVQQKVFESLELNLSLTPNAEVAIRPPRVDLVYSYLGGLLPEHREALFDGVAQSEADYIVVELKNTEGVNEAALKQAFIYHQLQENKVADKENNKVETFIVSVSTPQDKTLTQFGYQEVAGLPGVYKTKQKPWDTITLILINELEEKPRNAFVMLFASHKNKRRKAFDLILNSGLYPKTKELKFLLAFLWLVCFPNEESNDYLDQLELFFNKEKPMNIEEFISRVDMEGFTEIFGASFLRHFPAEQRVADLTPAERVADLTPAQRVADLSIEELEDLLEKKRNRLGRYPNKT